MDKQEMLLKNHVDVVGAIIKPFTYSHKSLGESFYSTSVSVKRTSGYTDIIPVIVSERLIDCEADYENCSIEIHGQYRSYRLHDDDGKSRLILFIFAQSFEVVDSEKYNKNEVGLDGYICRTPSYRTTPYGREIADVLLAVNRQYGKSDYIPCIFWGRNARHISTFDTGTHCSALGRIQSRQYVKRFSETESCEMKTAYEVSVQQFEILD